VSQAGERADVEEVSMKMTLVSFGLLDIEGQSYDYDVVIEQGKVRKRKKKASKPYRGEYGHTPLSAAEDIPWHGKRLYVGTGAYGSLPVMPEVYNEAADRGVEIIAVPTEDLCKLVKDLMPEDVNAILHVTC
jgi:hypothetical protein